MRTTAVETVVLGRERRRLPAWLDIWRQIARGKPLAFLGLIIAVALFLTAILATVIAPYPYDEIHAREALTSPGGKYLLGSDELGRDILSRIIYGARVSVYVAMGTIALSMSLATVLALVSAYFGGWLDLTLQRVVDLWMAFPPLVLLLTMMSFLGPGILQLILALGLSYGFRQSRVIRGTVLSIKTETYMEGAAAIGCSHWRTIVRHVLPNTMAPMIVVATVDMPTIILTEASLSFLGYGIPRPFPSWGSMISSQLVSMGQAPWLSLFPGLAIMLVVFGWNVLGDGLRDLLDPRLRGGKARFK